MPGGAQSLRVLLVEDDASLAEMYALLPRREGHEVLVASDGERAIELALGEAPDLVLLDIRLPRKNGIEVLEDIRARGYRGIVWILSSYSQRQMVARALAAGATRWLIKTTLTPRELTNLLRTYAEAGGGLEVEERLRKIGSLAETAVLVADDAATYLAVSPAAARLLEAEPSAVVGRHVWDFTPVPNLAAAEELWQRFVQGGSDSGPYVLRTAAGHEVHVRYSAFANVSGGLHVSVLEPETAI